MRGAGPGAASAEATPYSCNCSTSLSGCPEAAADGCRFLARDSQTKLPATRSAIASGSNTKMMTRITYVTACSTDTSHAPGLALLPAQGCRAEPPRWPPQPTGNGTQSRAGRAPRGGAIVRARLPRPVTHLMFEDGFAAVLTQHQALSARTTPASGGTVMDSEYGRPIHGTSSATSCRSLLPTSPPP